MLPCAVAQKLVQRCPSLTSFNVTYQCISRALFTLHQPPTLRSGPWGCAAAGAASEALCVSDSLGLPDPDMQRALRPVLYAHQGGTIPVFPISFSLPEDLFVRAVPQKTKYFSSIMPGNGSTYLHNLEVLSLLHPPAIACPPPSRHLHPQPCNLGTAAGKLCSRTVARSRACR